MLSQELLRSLWNGAQHFHMFKQIPHLPISTVLFLKTVLETAKGYSAHAQGRLVAAGNEPCYLPPHRASHPQPMSGRSWHLNTPASPLDGDNSEVCFIPGA